MRANFLLDNSARGNPATICMPVVFLCLSLSFAPIFTQARVFHGTATVDMRNYLRHFFAVVRPTPPPIVERSIVMRMSVCVCVCVFVCPRSYLRNYTSDPHQIFGACYLWLCSVLHWRRSDTLCTSGFMDDVIFAHKQWLLDVAARLKRSAHAALGLAINCA